MDGLIVTFGTPTDKTRIAAERLEARIICVGHDVEDVRGILAWRYGASPGTTYLFRPDQYVAARWSAFDESEIVDALRRASGHRTARQKELAA